MNKPKKICFIGRSPGLRPKQQTPQERCKHTKAKYNGKIDEDGIKEMCCPTCKNIVYNEVDL